MSRVFTHGNTWPPVFLLLAFAILTVACAGAPGAQTPGAPAGSGPAGVPTPATPANAGGGVPAEMCPLISGEDIAMIADMDLDATQQSADGSCSWRFTGTARSGSVTVRYENDDITLEGAKALFRDGEDVSIGGDRGYLPDELVVLYVVKGAHVYAVQLFGFDPTDPRRKDILIETARLLLAKV